MFWNVRGSATSPGEIVAFDGSRRGSPAGSRMPQPAAPWGDGLVEQSLASLYGPCSWDEVGEDELALLLPALTSPSAVARGGGPAPHFRNALQRWTAITGDTPPRHRRDFDEVRRILETLLRHAETACPGAAPSPGGSPPRLSVEEAALGAVHGCIHPAYADPRLAALHETLTVCCWLGHLYRGRDALLSPGIAAPLGALLTRDGASTGRGDPAAGVVVHYAAAGGGAKSLRHASRSVCKSGRPLLVRSTAPDNRWPPPPTPAAAAVL